jgi:hypothetical protein
MLWLYKQFTSNNQHIDLKTLFIYTLSRHAIFTLIISRCSLTPRYVYHGSPTRVSVYHGSSTRTHICHGASNRASVYRSSSTRTYVYHCKMLWLYKQFTSNNQHIDLKTLFIYTLSRHAIFTLIISRC